MIKNSSIPIYRKHISLCEYNEGVVIFNDKTQIGIKVRGVFAGFAKSIDGCKAIGEIIKESGLNCKDKEVLKMAKITLTFLRSRGCIKWKKKK